MDARVARRFILAACLGFIAIAVVLVAMRSNLVSTDATDAASTDPQPLVTHALPELTGPVNDFANVIGSGRDDIEQAIASLFRDTEDVIVVATVQTIAPLADIRDYSLEMFKNHGKGIGAAGKDNGILVLLAVNDRQVRITTGLGMESVVPDTLATQIVRRMTEHFSRGEIDAGLLAGVNELAARIRDERNRGERDSR